MFGSTRKDKARAAEYADARDFCRIFETDMNSLYLLALLLTGDHEKAQQSFVSGLDDATQRNTIFKEWARSWARRVIVQNALRAVNPRPGGGSAAPSPAPANFPDGGKIDGGKIEEKRPEIAAVLEIEPFDRFVFVLTVLEGYSDHDCRILLNSTAGEVAAARMRALEHLGRVPRLPGAELPGEEPGEEEENLNSSATAKFKRAGSAVGAPIAG